MSTLFMWIWFIATIAMFVWLVQGFLMKRKPARRKALYAFGTGFLAVVGGAATTPTNTKAEASAQAKSTKSAASKPADPAAKTTASNSTSGNSTQDRLMQARATLKQSCMNDLVGSYPEFAPSTGAITVSVPPTIKSNRVAMQLQAGGQRFNCSWTNGAQDNLLTAADPAGLKRAQRAQAAAAAAKAAAEAKAQAAAQAEAERQRVEEEARASRPPGNLEVVSDGYFGCTDKDDFKKIVGYAAQQDEEAFRSALGVGLMSGLCTTFRKGEEVLLQDTSVFSGMIKVRRKGELSEYWTNLEAAN